MNKKIILIITIVLLAVIGVSGCIGSENQITENNAPTIDGKEINFVDGNFIIDKSSEDQIFELEGVKFKIPKGYSGEVTFNNVSNIISCFITKENELILFSHLGNGVIDDFIKNDTKNDDMIAGKVLSIKNFDLYPVLYTGSGFSARLDFSYSPVDSDNIFMVVNYYYFEEDGKVFQIGKGFKYPFSSFTYDGNDLSEFIMG